MEREVAEMAEEQVEDTGQQEATSEAESGSGLRKQLEEVLADNKALKAQLRTTAFKEAGFDPTSGPGKALAKLYDGDADVDQIRQFAKDEFGFEPITTGAETAQQRSAGEQRLAQVQAGALPVRDPSLNDELQAAEAKAHETGDWSEFNRLSARKIEEARRAS